MTLIISSAMDLDELALAMEVMASEDQAHKMRDELIKAGYEGKKISEVPKRIWFNIIDLALGKKK